MKAAIIKALGQPPRYGDIAEPVPQGPNEILVDVLAVGLHHLTRGRASGAHYSSAGGFPQIAGVDGVGRSSDGKLHYFAQGPGQPGTMAEKTVVEVGHSVELPEGSDPVLIAGAMNPAMAAWLALRCRVPFCSGQSVLILGATGNAGNMAVQIARHLGASRVIGAGRNEQKLAKLSGLGATDTALLSDPQLGVLASDVDFVLDFLWGEQAVNTMATLLRERSTRQKALTWIHAGSMAGEAAPIPGALLRGANLQIVGSGHGSLATRDILTELPALAEEICRGTFRIDVTATPLSEVERMWSEGELASARIVFEP